MHQPASLHFPLSRTALLAAGMLCALLLAGAALAQGSATMPADEASSPAKKTERVLSDSWITTKVKGELFANSASKAFKVAVTTQHGVVHLRGKLPNQEGIDLVKSIAEKVEGVKRVDTSGLSLGG